MRRLLVFVILAILYASLYPFGFDFDRTDASPLLVLLHSWPSHFTRFEFRDGASNVLFYAPLGAVAFLVFRRRLWAALLLGIALSAGIEMLQVYDATRTCSLYDVVCNLAGTAAGAAAAMVLPIARASWPARERLCAAPLLTAAGWAVYQLYPFIPLLSRGHLRGSLQGLFHAPIAPVEVVASCAGWFVLALLAEGLLGSFPTPLLLLAMAALPLRLLIAGRGLAPAEPVGAAAALLLWAAIPRRHRAASGVWLMTAAILLRELAPFRFVSEPRSFSWVPFSATFAADRLPAVLVLFRKAYEYGAMVWLLRGIGAARAGVAVASILAVLEWAQRYQPNRQPEITDAVLALLMTVPLVWDTKAGMEARSRR